ncbi:PLP-dependent aminotransferase family protein [Pseudoteredinibacter isoporae]|uniref:GntR family transcriptional regulator/MocR family aminotransferase n=1 Tax=Pseudoteredinibacter isoporae TaxID=570281 RepID=A0A7X0JV41_9GAMM|nr:PLP-dependent aminotransferase family protein [Pseudoteredinibacter isoporae]MBB6522838.1 GntR family transcriptional regulator/MocR family aminotransferase [Pseudoteredinibacter isoporae]NHO88365.1 PLP-dependent aminotransferase family protein [Pseudoteredinibacter isoporae]NIB23304.1 PLP-dependent aminotransferase family protein [Pseudoteredinibacter isoporae]
MAIATSLQEIRQLELDRSQEQNLNQQLYRGLRTMMLGGQLPAGSQLPSSRRLAEQLNLGRNTVIAAYEQLQAEGYIFSKRGSGSFVASPLPDQLHSPADKPGAGTSTAPAPGNPRAHRSFNSSFFVGVPDLSAFPHKHWQRTQQQLQKRSADFMGYGDEAGFWPLRRAIAQYLQQSRAVDCHGGQVLITAGAQQGLDLCVRLLLGPDDVMAIESPGYRGVMRALKLCGKNYLPCPVDQDGISLQALKEAQTPPNLVYTTPANQYPMGAVLSLEKKMALLNWAREQQSWIIEDDYDSEYHYQHRPLASMQGLDRYQRVIYLGSFSKTLYPGLRLGYLVLPDSLMERFTIARGASYGQPPLMTQAQVASFMEEGHFNRHLRRMRLAYKEKLNTLQHAMKMLEPWGKTLQRHAGMHIVFVCHKTIDDEMLVSKLEAQGIFSSALSEYCHGGENLKGLVLGFANTPIEKMHSKVGVIKSTLESL